MNYPRARSGNLLPFYALPDDLKTSAEIINEARTCVKTIDTRRPFTPRESNRRLFGGSGHSRWPRPSSAFGIEIQDYDFGDIMRRNRLEPLDRVPKSAPSCLPSDSLVSESVSKLARSATYPDFSKILCELNNDVRNNTAKGEESVERMILNQCSNDDTAEDTGVLSSWLRDSQRRSRKPPERVETTVPQLPAIFGKLDESSKRSRQDERINQLLDFLSDETVDEDQRRSLAKELYETLEECQLLSSRHSKNRPTILRTLFKLLDSPDTHFTLQILRIIIAMRVTGNNLVNICKLMFKITRNDNNDSLFLNDNLLELFLKCVQNMDFNQDSEALVYSVGSLKFLSMDVTVLRHLSSVGCVETLTIHVHRINSHKRCNGSVPEQTIHVLFQLTGCLRNLAESSSNRRDFVVVGTVLELWHTLDLFPDDVDIVMNVARTLSKLTTYADVSFAIATQPNCHAPFLHLLKKYENRHELVVRLCYVLGNLTARDDQTRVGIHHTSANSNGLVELLGSFHEKFTGLREKDADGPEPSDGDKVTSEVEDVLIKLIRVVGNMCINEKVGRQMAANNQCVNSLLSILVSCKVDAQEELVLTTVAALNNLSYYLDSDGAVTQKQVLIAECLLQLLATDHSEGVVETLRVLGNLSRSRAVRTILTRSRAVETMVSLLDSDNREVVFLSAGVIVNLMADEENRPKLLQEGGITKLVKILRAYGSSDWHLSSIICQAIWNYCCKMAVTVKALGSRETLDIVTFLEQSLDESNAILNGDYEDMMVEEVERDVWEKEFCPVASRILDKIESCL